MKEFSGNPANRIRAQGLDLQRDLLGLFAASARDFLDSWFESAPIKAVWLRQCRRQLCEPLHVGLGLGTEADQSCEIVNREHRLFVTCIDTADPLVQPLQTDVWRKSIWLPCPRGNAACSMDGRRRAGESNLRCRRRTRPSPAW